MSDPQLRDEVMTLFLAGHETTANALAWTWYLLAQPGGRGALHAERPVLGGRRPRPRTCRAALRGRCWPSRCASTRRRGASGAVPSSRSTLGGYAVPAGALVLMRLFGAARSALLSGPGALRPRSLARGEGGAAQVRLFPLRRRRPPVHRGALRVDGGSAHPRHVARWRFRLEAGARVEPQALITLRPRRGVPMRVRRLG